MVNGITAVYADDHTNFSMCKADCCVQNEFKKQMCSNVLKYENDSRSTYDHHFCSVKLNSKLMREVALISF